jgi:hypothetical protein
MILVIFAILHFSLSMCQILPVVCQPLQEPRTSVVPFNATAMPVTINTAVAENRGTDSWLVYSITNKSQERIESIDLLAFIVDGKGKLISIEESSHTETIHAGGTQEGIAHIAKPITHNGLSIVAVTKAVGQSGVWTTDLSELKRVVTERINGRGDAVVRVAFEGHLKVTDTDKAKIFRLIVEDFLHDNAKEERAERIKDGENILVLNDNVEFDLPQLPNVNLPKLNKEEIQRLADERGRVFYLIYRPLVVEGARVMARLSLRDERARRPGAFIPYKFIYLFRCIKKDGNWIIENSQGYAES